ncbi:MAG: hypothetical protein AAFQ16_03770 [Pseudomonadota bacterium]
MAKRKTLTRRALLIGSAAVAGGVVFGVWRYKTPYPNPLLQTLEEGAVALTPYLRLDASGIAIITPRAEMGQGIIPHWLRWSRRSLMSISKMSRLSTAPHPLPILMQRWLKTAFHTQ